MAGRKPLGPGLVQHLDGSERAKERLEVILETIAGQLAIKDACARLGIGEAMFHKLRTRVLEACMEELEPKPRGRPRREVVVDMSDVDELEKQVDELRGELTAAEVRMELAAVLPHILQDKHVKKTTKRSRLEKAWTARQRRINRQPK